jgi:hypothetical protein
MALWTDCLRAVGDMGAIMTFLRASAIVIGVVCFVAILSAACTTTPGTFDSSGTTTVTGGSGSSDSSSSSDSAPLFLGNIQTSDPRSIELSDDADSRGDSVNISSNAEFITSVANQITAAELPTISLVGFDNQTGFNMLLTFTIDSVTQEAFVLDGDTLLLKYPCIGRVQLTDEVDFDPVTGDFVQEFALDSFGSLLIRGIDFNCGDYVVFSITPDEVIWETGPIS